MERMLRELYMAMVAFDRGDPELIQHFTKVHAYCRLIAEQEGLPREQRELLEAAALVHDIAIPLCRQRYSSDAGSLQEKEGPALAEAIMAPIGFPRDVIDRVCLLVGHHHTYTDMLGTDHQILVEADFLVNAYESSHSEQAKRHTLERIFRTETGRRLFREMFAL